MPSALPPSRRSVTVAQASTKHHVPAPTRNLDLGAGRATVFSSPSVRETEPALKAFNAMLTQQVEDPFAASSGLSSGLAGLAVLSPEMNLRQLAHLAVKDATLGSCIQAMCVNVDSFGYTLEYIGDPKDKNSPEVKEEEARIRDLMDRCNPDESMASVRAKMRRDKFTYGFGFLEIGRAANKEISFVYHVPAETVRVTAKDVDYTEVKVYIRRGGKLVSTTAYKRFRRFVQLQNGGAKRVFFKEFGDPRRIDKETGKAVPPGVPLPIDREATEIRWYNKYTPGYVYGLPPHISCITAILGSQEADLTNLDFFRSNAVPAMAVLVAGGMLSQEAIQHLRESFERKSGRDSMHKALILEARTPEEDLPGDGSMPPAPRLDIKPLTMERQGDALFQHYTANNREQVRQSFRLPPLIIGLASDYTRATAESSVDVAEVQVFGPERTETDEDINTHLLQTPDGSPPKYWRYRSQSPKIASPEARAKAIEQLDKVGAMTPNRAISLANDIFGLNIPKVEQPWGDLPYQLTNQLCAQGKIEPKTGFPEGTGQGQGAKQPEPRNPVNGQ